MDAPEHVDPLIHATLQKANYKIRKVTNKPLEYEYRHPDPNYLIFVSPKREQVTVLFPYPKPESPLRGITVHQSEIDKLRKILSRIHDYPEEELE